MSAEIVAEIKKLISRAIYDKGGDREATISALADALVLAVDGIERAAIDLALAKRAVISATNLAASYGEQVRELQSLAVIGERAIRERWYSDEFGFICCQQKDFTHAPGCSIPAQQARLEKEDRDDT